MSKALVVDDSRAVRMILGRMLRELGYEIAEAGNGKEALEQLDQEPGQYELILVDWNMPVMSGLELIQTVSKRPQDARMLIVMVTTETELGHMALALESGAHEYVMKPFTKETLLSKLEIVGAAPYGARS